MELKIKSSTQAKPFARQIDFLPDRIVLHADTDIVLTYQETSLNLCLHLGVDVVKRNGQDRLTTYPRMEYITFEFITNSFTYQIEHACTLQDVFKFIDYKLPFSKISYSFKNADKDVLTQKLAQNISVALEDHLQYGLHEPIDYPRMVQYGTPVGVPIYFGIKDKEKKPSSAFEKIVDFSILSLLPIISVGFIICVMGYLIPQWDMHDVVHWLFAGICLSIISLYVWFVFVIYKRQKLHKKLSLLKQAKKEKSVN